MKKISVISLFMLSLFVACDKIEDDKTVDTRFFPANSIRCLNALIFNYVVDEEGNHIKIAPDTVYFESWTGNDTIIDGRECVILWEKYERDMSEYPNREPVTPNVPLYAGAVYEAENGYVYLYEYEYVYDRSQKREKRSKKEIGISAVRGGTIVGDHDVIFAGVDEVITFSHTAYSKAVFGKGAVQAAKFLAGKPAGYYNMSHVIEEA